ncbi:MAG: hypothetical protein K1X89_31090, partial [Myxococcaceae bacterium]|nr:hypothetical protein [Myxococcaceae bacterium]
MPETAAAEARLSALLDAAGPALSAGAPVRITRQGDYLRRLGATADEPGLPAHAARAFTVRDERSGLALQAKLLGADAVLPEASGGLLVYPAAYRGADLWFRATPQGVEDFLLITRPGLHAVEYQLELSAEVAGLRLVENTLELLDVHGDPRLRLAPPRLYARGHAPVPATVTVRGCAVDTSGAPPWGRPVVDPGARSCTATVEWNAEAAPLPVVLDPQWSRTGSLAVARTAHQSVTVKSRALVLACGGYDSAGVNTTSCETFNEVTGTWSSSPSMPIPRAEFTLTYLDLPMVVALGGYSNGAETATIHLLETTNFSWTSSSQTLFLNQGVANHQAVAVSPSVLVVLGGQRGSGNCINRVGTIATYNAATDTFTQALQALNEGRAYHQATLLTSGPAAGQILVTGGVQTCCLLTCPGAALQGELFNPSNNAVTQVGAMRAPGRLLAASYALSDGGVLVAGGYVDLANLVGYASSEVYTFGSGFFDAGSLPFQAGAPGFALLSNGTPLLAGGGTDGGTRAEGRTALWVNGAWALDGPLNDARRSASTTVLPSGRVMVSGGAFGSAASPTELASTEVFGLLDAGASCAGDGLCASQHCSPQGVCCDTACTGACEACNQTGSVGTCKPSPAGFVCHASTGGCDPAEVCNGLDAGCPGDVIYDAGVVCRPAVGTCDVSEICTGTTQCPADVLRPPGFVCRPDAGACDLAESCDGLQGQCPVDSFVGPGATCRPSAGVCDLAEVCTGSAPGCPPDQVRTNTFLCRGASDLCDKPEFCDGFDAGCPADVLQDAGHVCRGPAGTCDFAEVCSGASASCPADTFFDAGVVCRPDAGPCDVAESCTGASGVCPADGFLPATAVCRAAAGVCDVAESCTGAAAGCPNDVRAPSTLTCRPKAGSCDVAEACDGTAVDCPGDQVRPQGQVCDVLYLCDGADAGCPSSCTTTSDCANGGVCTAGQCRGGKGPGQSCSSPLECQNGLCVDGVCCDVACDGACEACNRPGKLGTCGAVPAGNVGDPSCNPFVCDGNNRSCPTSCSSSTQCAPGLNCVGGLCRDTKPPGASCANGMQCASGFCTDGVCCDAKCDGACEACNVAGKEGACTPAAKGDPGAPACTPYTCDGTSGDCPSSCQADADCAAGAACVKGACSAKKLGHVGFGCSCGSGGFEGVAALALAFLWRRRRGGPVVKALPVVSALLLTSAAFAAAPTDERQGEGASPAAATGATAPRPAELSTEGAAATPTPDAPRLQLGGA